MQKEAGNIRIGVLSLQGGVIEHINHLKTIGVQGLEIKKISELENLDGLILPGGESTTLGNLLRRTGIMEKLKEKILKGFPVWGTCAGMILLSKKLYNDDTVHLGLLDVEVRRNGYGRQLDSFITEKIIPAVDERKPVSMVFIRAPYITQVLSEKVEVLASIDEKVVAVKQDNIIATAFHPELTNNVDFHKYFINHCLAFK